MRGRLPPRDDMASQKKPRLPQRRGHASIFSPSKEGSIILPSFGHCVEKPPERLQGRLVQEDFVIAAIAWLLEAHTRPPPPPPSVPVPEMGVPILIVPSTSASASDLAFPGEVTP